MSFLKKVESAIDVRETKKNDAISKFLEAARAVYPHIKDDETQEKALKAAMWAIKQGNVKI